MEPLVYVKKGEGFDPNLYVESVEDADGNLVAGAFPDGGIQREQPGGRVLRSTLSGDK